MVTSAENGRCSLGEQQLLQLPSTTSSDVEGVCGSLSPLPWTASKNEGMAGEGDNLLQDFLMWWDPECQDPDRRTPRSNAGDVNTDRSASADTSPSSSLPPPDKRLGQTSGAAPSRASETLEPVASLAECSSPDPSDTRVLAVDTKRSKTQRKDEVQMLRKEAHALVETLRALQQAARNPWKHTQDPWRLSEAPCTSLWKPVAERQRVRMERAQRENLELKLSVLEYKKLATSLRRALVKRVKRVVLLTEMMRLPPLRLLSALDLSSGDCAIFQRTVADIDSMCRNIDSTLGILQTTTAKSTDRDSFCKGAARLDASMAIFAEIVSCERVPFRKGQVENAMRLLHEDVKPGSRRYNAKRFGGAPQMIVTKARFRYPWSTGSGTFCACRAILPFDDGARSGSVRISYIAALDSEGKSVPGFLLKVQIWTILTEQVRAGIEETLIQTYTTIAPVQTSERCPFRWEREVVEQVVIPEWDRGIAGGRRELEKAEKALPVTPISPHRSKQSGATERTRRRDGVRRPADERLSVDAFSMGDSDLGLLLGVIDMSNPFDALLESQHLPTSPAIGYQEDATVPLPQLTTGWSGGSDDDHPLHGSTESDATRVQSGDHLSYQQLLSSKVAADVAAGVWTPAKRLRRIKAPIVWKPVQARVRSAVGTQAARSQAGGKGKRKTKYICTRERRRSEIQTLRDHATELEERIKRLQETTIRQSRGGENRTINTVVEMPPPHADDGRLVLLPRQSLWRHVAERQRERLRQSVEENNMLRNTIIRNAVKNDPEWIQLGHSPDDEAVFTTLLANVDAMYVEVDRVVQTLERKVPPTRSGAFRDWDVKQAGGGGDGSGLLSLEMTNSEQMPFARSDVHRACFGVSLNAPLGKTHVSFSSDLQSGTYHLRFVSKYVVEETRSIFMTTALIDSVNASGESVDGLVLKEQKWTILASQDYERDCWETETTTTTLIQILSLITPEFMHPSFSSLWHKDIVESVVIPTWDSAFYATQRRLENILLDQALT